MLCGITYVTKTNKKREVFWYNRFDNKKPERNLSHDNYNRRNAFSQEIMWLRFKIWSNKSRKTLPYKSPIRLQTIKKYDGTVRSLALKSRRPHNSPNAHTEEELKLIKDMYRRNGIYGLAEVYVRCLAKGYTRSFWSMCRQILVKGYKNVEKRRKSYTKYIKLDGKYPGDKVQVDIKHVPQECIKFPAYGCKYYQITAIDEFSRKRILKIVKEKSTYETSKF